MQRKNSTAAISWKLSGDGDISSLIIERAAEGKNFEQIKQYDGSELSTIKSFEFTDQLNNPSGSYAYRMQIILADGQLSYSSVQTIAFKTANGFKVQAINSANGGPVTFRVSTTKAGNYVFSLFNLDGNKMAAKSIRVDTGIETMQMESRPLKSGIYILTAEGGNQMINTKLYVL